MSPSEVTNSDLLNEIKSLRQDFTSELAKLRKEFTSQIDEIKENMGSEITTLTEKVNGLQKQINLQNDKLLHHEAHGRRLNIIVNNLEENDDESSEEIVKQMFVEKLKIPEATVREMLVRDVHRLPLPRDSRSNKTIRPLIIAFIQQKHRNMIIEKSHLLRGEKISVKTDLPKQLDLIRNEYLMKRKELNGNGHIARVVERSYKPVLQIKKGDKWIKFEVC